MYYLRTFNTDAAKLSSPLMFPATACILLLSLHNFVIQSKSIQIESVTRKINLNSHKLHAQYSIVLLNLDTTPLPEYQLILKAQLCSKVFHISAKANNLPTNVNQTSLGDNSKYCYFTFVFRRPLTANDKANLVVNVIFAHRFQPYPDEAEQNQEHSFIFYDDFYFDSLYPVKKQVTKIAVSKSRVLETTLGESVKISSGEIELGPFENTQALATKPFYIVFRYPSPIFVIDSMETTYHISELGMIKVHSDFWVKNNAAKLVGPYTRRFDGQSNQDRNTVYGWQMRIPADSYNIYYRDGLGNISTSAVERQDTDKVLHLAPRFPIFGSWKTYYYVSYMLTPLNHLFIDSKSRRHFAFDLLGDPMKDYLIGKAKVTIFLPEGASDMRITYEGLKLNVSKTFDHSYLDYTGRHVYVLSLENACAEKNIAMKISYQFEDKQLLKKPLMISIAIFVILFMLQVTSTMKIPVLRTKVDDEREHRQQLVDRIKTNTNSLKELTNKYMIAVRNFKNNKNATVLNQQINEISLKQEYVNHLTLGDIKSLQAMDSKQTQSCDDFKLKNNERKEVTSSYEKYSRELVNNEMTREEYAKKCKPLEDKVQELNEIIETIISTL